MSGAIRAAASAWIIAGLLGVLGFAISAGLSAKLHDCPPDDLDVTYYDNSLGYSTYVSTVKSNPNACPDAVHALGTSTAFLAAGFAFGAIGSLGLGLKRELDSVSVVD